MKQPVDILKPGQALELATKAVDKSQEIRAEQRRRKRMDREEELRRAVRLLEEAGAQVKFHTYRARTRYVEREDDLRRASDAIQRERRKVLKMIRLDKERWG
jgi:hypothetical protein